MDAIRISRGLIVAIALFVATPALAYLPPSFFILRQVARKQADLKNIVIRSRITFTDGGNATELLHVGEGRVAVLLKNEEGKTLASASRTMGEEGGGLPLLYGLSLQRNSAALFSRLKAAGLPLKTEAQLYGEKDESRPELPYKPETIVGLVQDGDRVLLVVSPDGKTTSAAPALVVDKGSLLPVRALIRADGGESLEYRIDQHSVYQNSFYPRRIEVLKNGEPWARIDLIEIKAASGGLPNAANRIYDDAGALSGTLENYMRWVR